MFRVEGLGFGHSLGLEKAASRVRMSMFKRLSFYICVFPLPISQPDMLMWVQKVATNMCGRLLAEESKSLEPALLRSPSNPEPKPLRGGIDIRISL